jgi:cardiolipin synthase
LQPARTFGISFEQSSCTEDAILPSTVSNPGSAKDEMRRHLVKSKAFFWLAVVCIAFAIGVFFLALFEPGLEYQISKVPHADLGSEPFLRTLEALANAHEYPNTRVEVLTNGESFYEAELEAIRSAQKSVNLEAYIFQKGELAGRFLEALTERARAGVKVNLVIDAIGALNTEIGYFDGLRNSGGRVYWYHPVRWYSWPRVNNRTHRELLIIDGRIGFIGGAGFADHWYKDIDGERRWRDSMYRVEGEAVARMQSTFAENWVEASGEILMGPEYFPFIPGQGKALAMVIDSTPSAGRSTRARMLFQVLLAAAKKSIHITTPYFVPDASMRDEMIRAIKERGVEVAIVVPGQSDHLIVRRTSRRLYGELLEAGARIYEYQPSMMHAKGLIIDRVWSVVGSTNFDPRSFALNDEVNLAVYEAEFAERLEADFTRDMKDSRQITLEEWRNRPVWEIIQEWFGALFERQQ